MIIKLISPKEMIKIPSEYDMMIQRILEDVLDALNLMNGENIDRITRIVVERALEELKNNQAIS